MTSLALAALAAAALYVFARHLGAGRVLAACSALLAALLLVLAHGGSEHR